MLNNKTMKNSRSRTTIVALLLALSVAFAGGTCYAATLDVYLYAGATNTTMPDGTVITMWGFANEVDGDFGILNGTVSVPGPRISSQEGDTLNIHLYNNLTDPVSLVIPGQVATMTPVWTDGTTGARTSATQRVRSFTNETAPGATVVYSWSGVAAAGIKAGTFIYQSGTHPSVQVQMGLYGALTVDDAGGGQLYGTAFTNSVLLLYSEVDKELHDAVAAGDYGPGQAVTSTFDYVPDYHLVNGTPYTPGNLPTAAGDPGEPLLIRFLNAGLKTHVLSLLGNNYLSQIAEDGNPYPFARTKYSVDLPAGKTLDAVITPAAATYLAVFDRRLNLVNGRESGGGMLSYLEVASTPQNALTVDKDTSTGSGRVYVASAPGGIDCGIFCITNTVSYNGGTQLLLSAAAHGDSTFVGWTGGTCTGSSVECVVTMDAAVTASAIFAAKPDMKGVVRNSGTSWYLKTISGVWNSAVDLSYTFGASGDVPVAGDWDGDGVDQIGEFRNGTWYLDDGDGAWSPALDTVYSYGRSGDVPVTGDWDGDGDDDIGVFRSGVWYLDSNGNGSWSAADAAYTFGRSTDVPVTGDWDGDGTTQIGAFRSGVWYLDSNGNGAWNTGVDAAYTFGRSTDVPVTGDWDGDGLDEIGVFRSGAWYLDNGNGSWNAATDFADSFGQAGDTPLLGIWQ